MGTTGFDRLAQAGAQAGLEQQRIREQQRVEQQNTVGARLLDAINNASNVKPQIKDENGNLIHNPEYDTAQDAKQKLLSQYVTLNSPEQHASFAQHLHGLIFGHPDHRTQQPALSPNSSPNEPSQPSFVGGMPSAPTPAEPLHPMAAAPPDHPIHGITKGIKDLGDHLKAFANPLPPQEKPDPVLIAQYYRDPGQVQFERQMEGLRQRGITAEDVAKIRAQYALMNTPEKMFLDTAAKSLGADNFMGLDPSRQADIFKQYKSATQTPVHGMKVNPADGLFYTYQQDPSTGQTTASIVLDSNGKPFGGFKPDTVHYTNKMFHFVGADGVEHAVPETTTTRTIFGPHAEENDKKPVPAAPTHAALNTVPATTPAQTTGTSNPEPITSTAPPPGAASGGVTPQAASLAAVNAQIKANPGKAGAPSKKAFAAAKAAATQPGENPGISYGPAKLSQQQQGVLAADKQIMDAIDDVLPLLEKMKNKNSIVDRAEAQKNWWEYQAGFQPPEEQAEIIKNLALISIAGAGPWTRIGRNRYTFDTIQKHLPKPNATPAFNYAQVKWLKDNVIPSSQEATLHPANTGSSGPKKKGTPEVPTNANNAPIVVSPEDLK